MKPGKIRLILIAVALLVVLAFVWRWFQSSTNANPAVTAGRPAGPGPITVDVATAKRSDVAVHVEGLGTVQALNTVNVTARVDGQIEKIGFTEGQDIKAGALIAQIDARPYKAALDQATAVLAKDTALLANAKRDQARYATLSSEQLTSKQTLDTQNALVAQTEAQIKADQAAVDNAKTQLAYTSISSPINGRTGIRQIDVGNIVHAAGGNSIVVVTQLQPIAVIFNLPATEVSNLNAAMGHSSVAAVALSADGKAELDHGTVSVVDNQIDPTTGMVKVKAVFPNNQRTLWPGQFVNARVMTQVMAHAVTVPADAVQHGPTGVFVYTVKDGSSVAVSPITIAAQEGNTVIVSQGVDEGQQVVTSNQYRLQPSSKIKIKSAAAPAASAAAQGDAK